jgi:hypothetical protein
MVFLALEGFKEKTQKTPPEVIRLASDASRAGESVGGADPGWSNGRRGPTLIEVSL